jgi:cytosine deaminase
MDMPLEPYAVQALRAGAMTVSCGQQAAEKAVSLAWRAVRAGTFGVGGLLMRSDGQVLAEAVNAVVRDGVTVDTTAHVERQLIDWYFEAKRRGLVARPEDLVIVTSLDSCAMCAGAILLSGMKSVALASDPMSGVHDGALPHRMPRELWETAEARMGFFRVDGRSGSAEHIGEIFFSAVSAATLREAEEAFEDSLDQVRRIVHDSGRGQDSRDEAGDLVTQKMLATLAELKDDVIPESGRIPGTVIRVGEADAGRQLHDLLVHEASALADASGNLLLSAQGREDLSPIRSSVMELTRAYIPLRRIARERLGLVLPQPRACSVVKMDAPKTPAKALMELGAIGSFCEGPREPTSLPALALLEADDDRLKRMAASLPPLYTSVIKLDAGSVRCAAK